MERFSTFGRIGEVLRLKAQDQIDLGDLQETGLYVIEHGQTRRFGRGETLENIGPWDVAYLVKAPFLTADQQRLVLNIWQGETIVPTTYYDQIAVDFAQHTQNLLCKAGLPLLD